MKIYNLNFPWDISASKQLPHRSINKLDLKDCFYIELKLSLFYIETRKNRSFLFVEFHLSMMGLSHSLSQPSKIEQDKTQGLFHETNLDIDEK